MTLSTHQYQFFVAYFLLLTCKPDHNGRSEHIEDSHLRRLGSLDLRNHSHDIFLCFFHVSNGTTPCQSPTLTTFALCILTAHANSHATSSIDNNNNNINYNSNNNTDNDNDNDNDNDSNHSNFYPGSPLASWFLVWPCKSIKSMRVLCNKINNDSADSDC